MLREVATAAHRRARAARTVVLVALGVAVCIASFGAGWALTHVSPSSLLAGTPKAAELSTAPSSAGLALSSPVVGPTPEPVTTPNAAARPTMVPRTPRSALRSTWLQRLPPYVSRGPGSKKLIVLTFDADMYPWMYVQRDAIPELDPRIIDLLETTHTPATIFLNGLWAKAYPKVVKRLVADPRIELANHSWDHAAWTTPCPNTTPIAPPMTERTEVTDVASLVRRRTAITVRLFRFPGGCHTNAELSVVRSLGEEPVGWSCFFGDTYGWSAAAQVASVEHGCTPGSIVITHLNGPPFHPNVYEALETLIPWWKEHGWTVANVGTMLGLPAQTAGH
jgi:peptidoglycan/xylan/chitin deacetylase (PgdA/CDA1 family)